LREDSLWGSSGFPIGHPCVPQSPHPRPLRAGRLPAKVRRLVRVTNRRTGMHTHENDWASAEKQHSPASRRDEGMEAMASLALAAGLTDALPPAAVLHLQRTAGNASVSSLYGAEHEDDP